MRKFLLVFMLAACGSSSSDPPTVYDVAYDYATHVCDYFAACGVEGTHDDCMTDVLAGTCADADCSNWTEEWSGSEARRDLCFEDLDTASCDDVNTPPASCDGVI